MKKEVKIGLAGIGALLILFFGINYLKGISMFKPESYYYVDFTDVNGLAQSSPVFANGYKIGIVRDLQYDHQHPGHVIVGIEVDQDLRIPTGSKAELVTEMLGTVKMNMMLQYESTTFLNPGDTIEGTANTGILGKAEKDLLPKVEQMMPKLDSILSSLNQLLADPSLKQTLHNAEKLTASLNATSVQLHGLMSKDIPQLTSNVTAFQKVDSTLQNVHLLTEKLGSKDNSIGLLLNDDALYKNLNATSANAASLLKDLQEHPKRYVHFSLFGKKDK